MVYHITRFGPYAVALSCFQWGTKIPTCIVVVWESILQKTIGVLRHICKHESSWLEILFVNAVLILNDESIENMHSSQAHLFSNFFFILFFMHFVFSNEMQVRVCKANLEIMTMITLMHLNQLNVCVLCIPFELHFKKDTTVDLNKKWKKKQQTKLNVG
jgi:hypothetical protein